MYCSRNVFSKQSHLYKFTQPTTKLIARRKLLVGLQEFSNDQLETSSYLGKNGNFTLKRFLHSTSNKTLIRTKVTGFVDIANNDDTLKKEATLDFEDFEKAFKAKSTWEITRALMVYKLCSFDFLVQRNKMVSAIFKD